MIQSVLYYWLKCNEYIVCIGSDRPTLKQLHNHVVMPAAYKWRDLGVQLLENDQIVMLYRIASNHPHDDVSYCKDVLKRWLETRVDASWNQLIRVLRSPLVELDSLAEQLEQMMSTECKIYVLCSYSLTIKLCIIIFEYGLNVVSQIMIVK